MDIFLETEVTKYEVFTLELVIENLMVNGIPKPSTDDVLHELIRLSSITIKHLK